MNNTKQIIDNHNKRILNSSKHINDTADNTNTIGTKTCNCQQKNACPLNRNCFQSSLIYQATVTRKDNSTTETYIGLTENNFKTRYRNHTASFRYTKLINSTELNRHIWTLKENNISSYISWRILSSRSPYSSANKRCNLCLKEKLLIIRRPELSSLNKRNDSCPHAATETKRYYVTIVVLFLCKFIKYIINGTKILKNKIPWWVSNHEIGL